jgi:hypothetical protein
MHGAELVDLEDRAAAAMPLLFEENWATRIELDGDRNQQERRSEQDEEQGSASEIENAFENARRIP